MTDIREQAAKAAREWRLKQKHPADPLHGAGEAAYQIGYEAGYEAAKAEAMSDGKFCYKKMHAIEDFEREGCFVHIGEWMECRKCPHCMDEE